MRRTLLFFFLIVAGCALPRPTEWRPSPRSFSGAEGRLFFEVSTPKGKFEGESFFVAGPDFLYLEGLSPFGLALFQGLLKGEMAQLVLFPEKRAYFLKLDLPEEITRSWGGLLLGYLPSTLLEGALVFESKNTFLLKKESGPFRILVVFNRDGRLKELAIKKERTLLRLAYRGQEVSWTVPPARSKGKLLFESLKPLEGPERPSLVIPAGFERSFWEFRW